MYEDIPEWVGKSNNIPSNFKKAVHIILTAISLDSDLSSVMVMKGGILMGVKYGSERFTTDIDFSNDNPLSEDDLSKVKERLQNALDQANVDILNGIQCRLQSIIRQPKKEDAPFPSLKIKIGYAETKNGKQISRLKEGKSSDIVSIDYSFNEYTGSTEKISLTNSETINCYSLTSMISEKFRSILQQEFRNRNRRQDVYDLYILISNFSNKSEEEKEIVLQELIDKSKNKGIDSYLNKEGLGREEIINRSKHAYDDMKDEISGDLIEFDVAYGFIKSYFESLPW